MDRVTQLQESLDHMSHLFVTGLDYLHTRAPMVAPVGSSIPVTKANERAEAPGDFERAMQDFARDLCKQNRRIDTLISALPGEEASEQDQTRQFEELAQSNEQAAARLREAIAQARTMLDHTLFALRLLADDQAQGRSESFRHFTKASVRCLRAGATGVVVAADYKWSLRHKPDPADDPATLRAAGVPVDAAAEARWQEALHEFASAKSQVHLRSARRVRACLMQSGGIYIKLGQHLAAMTYLLPKEWTDTMTPLQDQCPQTDLADIAELIQDDLGCGMDDLFSTFDPQPLGVASLAQVHRAVLRENGEEVAVKVQHPYLDEFVQIDMRTVSTIIDIATRLFPEFQFGWLSEEMNVSLPQELNFVRERANAERVALNFAPLPNCPLVIPQVFWAHRRIMAMEYINGGRVDDVAYMRAHGINPDEVATELTRVFSEMMFIHGWVHCDPHPGNILVRPAHRTDSGYNFDLALLDHGLYRELSSEFRLDYARMWRALMSANEADIRTYSKRLAGTDLYIVFSCILTGRDWQVIRSDLGQARTATELEHVVTNVPNLLVQIVDVLATVPRELLLLFKTNDLLRSVDQAIRTTPSPAITMAIMGRYCTKAIYNESMAQLRCQTRKSGYSLGLLRDWLRCQYAYWRIQLPLEIVEWCFHLYARLYSLLML
ncbi:hypothetical protein IWQ60_001005 [Tieghemiomyces parasiticus]|uniref:Mediator of RNA polymerase II transcription subunit 21 n=1 Tax=Tieghemiomyces parasiticus TaxID=78921 RepID=A0A9W8AHT9_9FUNG|nr:hypothetical protein IWQ60_001005 [Tieghemiomyces parasiticus]